LFQFRFERKNNPHRKMSKARVHPLGCSKLHHTSKLIFVCTPPCTLGCLSEPVYRCRTMAGKGREGAGGCCRRNHLFLASMNGIDLGHCRCLGPTPVHYLACVRWSLGSIFIVSARSKYVVRITHRTRHGTEDSAYTRPICYY
jgi:hypothetical protein